MKKDIIIIIIYHAAVTRSCHASLAWYLSESAQLVPISGRSSSKGTVSPSRRLTMTYDGGSCFVRGMYHIPPRMWDCFCLLNYTKRFIRYFVKSLPQQSRTSIANQNPSCWFSILNVCMSEALLILRGVTKGTTTALARDILTSTQMNMEKRIGNAVTSCSSTFWQATLEVWSSTPLEQNTGGKLNPKEFWHFTQAMKS